MELKKIKTAIEDGLKKTGSWDKLADATGLNARTLSAWYLGNRRPRVAKFMQFIKELEKL